MAGRRWAAWFDQEILVLKRQRLLPWPKCDIKRFAVEAIIDIRPVSAKGWAKGRAQVTVLNPAAAQRAEAFEVQFAAHHRPRASLILHRGAAPWSVPPNPEPTFTPSPTATPADAEDVTRAPKQTDSAVKRPMPRRLPTTSTVPAPPAPPRRSTIAAIRADDGKRQVWLWRQAGKIHASLSPVGDASCHKLDPAELALLLLADPPKAMPAIRALTGIDNDHQALARVRSWRSSSNAVSLSASDLAGRQPSNAIPRPARQSTDSSIRTVSGGLPSLGKRRK